MELNQAELFMIECALRHYTAAEPLTDYKESLQEKISNALKGRILLDRLIAQTPDIYQRTKKI